MGFSGNRYLLAINGSAGAFVTVLAKSPLRRLEIEESPITTAGSAQTLQGLLDYQLPNDDTTSGFTTIFRAVGANTETTEGQVIPARIELGSPNTNLTQGELLGNGPNTIAGIGATPATPLINLRSGTTTATTVVITEYN
jgi:hypothetical protein